MIELAKRYSVSVSVDGTRSQYEVHAFSTKDAIERVMKDYKQDAVNYLVCSARRLS